VYPSVIPLAIRADAIILTGQSLSPHEQIAANPAARAAQAISSAASGTSLVGRTVADVERDLIIDTLQHCLGNRTHAANILGISIRTLRNKLKEYNDRGISVPLAGGEAARMSEAR
jgi:DNA-binding NtrC family response regulator